MDERQEKLERWRRIGKGLQEYQKENGLPALTDEEVEAAAQETAQMDERQKSLENWRIVAKGLQEYQKEHGLPVSTDEEVEAAAQEAVRIKFSTKT